MKDAEMGEVASGAKLMVGNHNRAESNSKETFYVKREGTVPERGSQFNSYSSGITFEIRSVGIKSDKAIGVQYEYSEAGVDAGDDKSVPPATFKYSWSGALSLESGKPVIAGGKQNYEVATFFIMTATIQDSEDGGKK